MREVTVLNLGAGIQSTTIYLMSNQGLEAEFVPRFDYAVFADTQEEPEAVYRHLEWLKSLGGIPILTGTAGKLGDDLINGVNAAGQRFSTIPAYTKADDEGGKEGAGRRQCTRDYKTDVVQKVIREQILGLKKGEHVTKDVQVHQYFGLSFDEARRRAKVIARFHAHPWSECHFSLFDAFITRKECEAWLKTQDIPHEVPRSACVFCPYHSNAEWRKIRDTDPRGWARALEIDAALRDPALLCTRGRTQGAYVHRSCLPLAEAPIDSPEPKYTRQRFSFSGYGVSDDECEGMCGV